MGFGITNHAVEQFCSRWRPDTPVDEAERELRGLVDSARPTRQRTPSRDAQIYVTTTEAGERIGLVVRDSHIITVLAHAGTAHEPVDLSADLEMYEESKADLAAARAALAKEPPRPLTPIEVERRANATRLIQEWQRGRGRNYISIKAVERAHNVLGIRMGDPVPPEPPPPPPPPTEDVVEKSRRLNAQAIIDKWKAGTNYSNRVLKKAHAILGIPFTRSNEVP